MAIYKLFQCDGCGKEQRGKIEQEALPDLMHYVTVSWRGINSVPVGVGGKPDGQFSAVLCRSCAVVLAKSLDHPVNWPRMATAEAGK